MVALVSNFRSGRLLCQSKRYSTGSSSFFLDNTVLHCIATTPIEDALYGNTDKLKSRVLTGVCQRLDRVRLGIDVTTVTYDRKELPASTLQAFEAVVAAEQKKSRTISESQTYRQEKRQQATGYRSQILADAEQYKKRVVTSVEADVNYFLEMKKEYSKSPESVLISMMSTGLSDILRHANQKFIIHSSADQPQELRLLLGPKTLKTVNVDHGDF